jgi:AcrR family transcriptional regulator
MAAIALPEHDLASPAGGTGTGTGLNHQEARIVEATLRCIARWGMGKTTLDDIARESGYSRATVYRIFPGGKDGLVETVARVEIARFFSAVADRLAAATSLEDLLVAGIAEVSRRLDGHEALQFLLAHEPEVILPKLAFSHQDEVLRAATAFAAPYLARWLGDEDAARAAEWVARIVLSYTSNPADHVDMGDEDSVRSLVRAFVLPGLVARSNVPA